MGPIRNNSKEKYQEYSASETEQINSIPVENDEENPENDDCFTKFGFVSSSEEKTNLNNRKQETSKTQIEKNINTQNQTVHLVEEIDAITALIIYDTYSKKHEFTSSPQHRAKIATSPNKIRDDIDRFDAVYSCLIDQSTSSRNNQKNKYSLLNNYLRDRFFTLPNVNVLKTFQQNEQSRISEEKKTNINRIPFIPNILSYQRACPHYNLDEMKWIRNHIC